MVGARDERAARVVDAMLFFWKGGSPGTGGGPGLVGFENCPALRDGDLNLKVTFSLLDLSPPLDSARTTPHKSNPRRARVEMRSPCLSYRL